MLTRYSVEELVDSAEEYFSCIPNWDPPLSKPFYSTSEAPELLSTFGALLAGLDLAYGCDVLDFGVGGGWTSWMMTQLGCRVIASDVSATALRMTEERYKRIPRIGAVPDPVFLLFDGHRLKLEDGSVDRVAVNDAFHHVPNPDEVLREFGRVLRPGGLCVMSEPGPIHSRGAQSQAEMRNFRVVERNIVLEDVVAQAGAAGFASVDVAVFCSLPTFVEASSFDASIRPDSALPNEVMSAFLANRRLLRLRKAGDSVPDSRRRAAVSGRFTVEVNGDEFSATIENTGPAVWLQAPGVGCVGFGAHLFDDGGQLIDLDFLRVPLSPAGEPIEPGATVRVRGRIPELGPGRYRLDFDLVSDSVCWFADNGQPPTSVEISR